MYGCSAEPIDHLAGAVFDDPPGVHHRDLVRLLCDDAEIVTDENQCHARFLLETCQQLEDLGLHGDVERRGRLVGDQEIGPERECHRDHDSLAHPARQLVRVGLDPGLRTRDPDAP